MAEDEEGAINCKVVLVGETSVGKTSIINRFKLNIFKNQDPTTGGTFFSKLMILEDEKKSIKFEIWDTAGQEKYRALTKLFYKNAAVCIIVYDITRASSFEEIKKFWIEEIKKNCAEDTSK